MRIPLVVSLSVALASFACAEAVKDREGAVRRDRAEMERNDRWIYNDWQRGFAEAKRLGKPLMVVLRCVPCLACSGIDAQVLLEDPEIAPLLDQFVCVRVINANSLDLRLFQFDYDLSFSTLFFNGDGTVYGRYGSWAHQKDAQERATSGYKKAMEGALALHREYPGNKASLAGKQGEAPEYRTPIEMPGLNGKYTAELNWNGKVVQSCVHCHQIGDAQRLNYRKERKPIPTRLIYPWPAPETIGLTLAPDQAARVDAVAAGSLAAAAGFAPGDRVVSLEDQPLISIADVSWVLDRAPAKGALNAVVDRNGALEKLTVYLPEGWRTKTDISRRVGTWPMRGMATGGLVSEDLSDQERQRRGLQNTGLAMLVKHVGEYGEHAAAKKAGFRKDDVIVQLGDMRTRLTESEMIGAILSRNLRGEKLAAVVLRGDQRVELMLPVQ